tara:strand:+ start:303 stop:527 length:225 start_codon:yes stop_codon:yes gene_type:complete
MENPLAVLTLTLRNYFVLVLGIVVVVAVLLAAIESLLHRLRDRNRSEPEPVDSVCPPASTARTRTRLPPSIELR